MEAPASARYHLASVRVPHVHFTTVDPVNLPLPDARYLKLHAACSRIVHLSGAAEFIDKILRDAEDATALACDGTPSELLEL